MRVCILTLGTRGDVQPYVALAVELIQNGHSAVICTGESFRHFIEENGVEYARATTDLMALATTPDGKKIIEAPLKNLSLTLHYVKDVLNPAYRKTLDDFYRSAKGADLLVYHPKALGAPDIGLALNIPFVSLPPVPITYPVSEFPNLAVSPAKSLGHLMNRLSYQLNRKAESSQIKEINDFRAKTLGLPARKAGLYTFYAGEKEIPILYPVSALLFPEVHSWDHHVFLPGFFRLSSAETPPEEKLERFLADGPAPIAVSFSSMPLKQPELFVQCLQAAVVRAGLRAVVLTGNSGMRADDTAQLCFVKAAPHDRLFPRVKGVLHHGGVGTMAAALYAGVPQLVMPFSADQPFWAARLYAQGLAGKPLRETELNAERLEHAFAYFDDAAAKQKAAAMAQRLRAESGTARARTFLEAVAAKGPF